MRKILMSACCLAALAAASSMAPQAALAQDAGAEPGKQGWWVSVEGGVAFSASDESLDFDDGDKLGDLDSLAPGDDGFEARFEAGKQFDQTWDHKVGVGVLSFGDASDRGGFTFAEQDLVVGLADIEVGYRPEWNSAMDLRFSAGVRGLTASGKSNWSDVPDVGEFTDRTWAIGPRFGVEASVPVNVERALSLVGSVGVAALFGERSTDYEVGFLSPARTSYSESVTIWNVDASVGLNKAMSDGSSFTIGYRAQGFGNLAANRFNVGSDGITDFVEDGGTTVIAHGPFAKFTIPLN
jgi:opacity protein-like surface antigen